MAPAEQGEGREMQQVSLKWPKPQKPPRRRRHCPGGRADLREWSVSQADRPFCEGKTRELAVLMRVLVCVSEQCRRGGEEHVCDLAGVVVRKRGERRESELI